MVMPDTRISLFAGGMAERARQILELENDTLQDGELWIGMLDENALGISWKLLKMGRTTILRVRVREPLGSEDIIQGSKSDSQGNKSMGRDRNRGCINRKNISIQSLLHYFQSA